MLKQQRVLIVEDEPIIAIDLQCGLEDALAEVVGPARALRHALELAQIDGITAAIVDLQLKNEDVAPLIELLVHRRVPLLSTPAAIYTTRHYGGHRQPWLENQPP